jgi:hypothetical protein
MSMMAVHVHATRFMMPNEQCQAHAMMCDANLGLHCDSTVRTVLTSPLVVK